MRSMVVLLGLLCAAPVMADESMPASDASIRELLVVTDSEKLINGVYEQLDSMMQGMMQQTLAGHTLTPEQQTIIDDMRARMVAIFKEEMSWSVFEPMMIEIYRTTFTESEVQGMLQFYKSDPGRAVVAKMPAVMQASVQLTQQRLSTMLPKIQQLQQETSARLKATCAPDCGG
jgi:uncharacterized protein